MYEVKLNGEILHKNDTKSKYRLSSGIIAEEVNQIPVFNFTIPAINPHFCDEIHDRLDTIELVNTLTYEVEFEGTVLTHGEQMSANGLMCKKVMAEGFLGYLCDSVQPYRHYENTTSVSFLESLLECHNAQVSPQKRIYIGICDIAKIDYTGSKTTAYRTTLDEIKVNLIERIGGEICIRKVDDTLYLDYREQLGMQSNTVIELAKNLKSLSTNFDSTNIVTRLIPLGAQLDPGESAERLTIAEVNGGCLYIDDEEAISRFGIIVGKAEFDDITLPENLIEKGREYLADNNRIRKAYAGKVLDLSTLDRSKQSIRCGNTYRFKNQFFGLNEDLRLLKRTVDIFKPYAPEVQIGDKTENITSITAHQAELIEYKLPEQKLDILSLAKKNASSLIKAGFRGHVIANDSEICIMDTDNIETAQKVWRFNLGGFGYSDTGYDGTYRTAMTMDGEIVADFITAGVLRGIEISNGDGTFHVAPDGTVTASAMNILGGSIEIETTGDKQDVISLNHNGDRLYIAPEQLRVKEGSSSDGILIQGSMIAGYSHFEESTEKQTFYINSDSGVAVMQNVCFLNGDSGISVRDEIEYMHNYFDANNSNIQSLWNGINANSENIQYLVDVINGIIRGE